MLSLVILSMILTVFVIFVVIKYIDFRKVMRNEITQEEFDKAYRVYFWKMIKNIVIPLILLAAISTMFSLMRY